ncbi:Autophagy-related protein 2 [Talaromyces islandicus]|uniref:Autophagy-related protein 2 n=1 Tax=Talaromyces islandicus TaxID=28573 RepID=A0A0U1LWI8_TALIS|nr:Autophagy-related protein 2 [Talaromyces islandicus]
MAFFLPWFVQKRLLRYALTRIDLLDLDALDLDGLGFRWGQKSSIQLQDIDLKVEARVSLLRLNIPADLYNDGVVVEIEGIDVQLRLLSDDSPEASRNINHPADKAPSEDNILPTTDGLAESFLKSEPKEEREELEAAISSQSQYLQQSTTSLSDDGEVGIGNEGLSLPSFISSFIQGITDRLQAKVNGINIRIAMDLPQDGPVKRAPENKPDQVTALLVIQEISASGLPNNSGGEDSATNQRGRTIIVNTVHAMLVSDPVVFSNYSRFTAAPLSPSTTHSKTGRESIQTELPSPSQPPSMSDSTPDLSRSVMWDRSQVTERSTLLDNRNIESSTHSLEGRFSDAGSEAEYGPHSYSVNHSVSGSHYDDVDEEVGDNPAYMDDVFHSQYLDDVEDSGILPLRSTEGAGTPRAQSPQLDSSLSAETWHDFDQPQPSVEHQEDHNLASSHFRDGALEETFQTIFHELPPSQNADTSYYAASFEDLGAVHSDNKSSENLNSSRSSSSSSSQTGDLSESKLFTHEEASSMYMSAISHSSDDYNPAMPGAWDSSSFREEPKQLPTRPQVVVGSEIDDEMATKMSTPKLSIHTGASTLDQDKEWPGHYSTSTHSSIHHDRSQTPSDTISENIEVARKVLEIDRINIWIPLENSNGDPEMHQELQESHEAGTDTKFSTNPSHFAMGDSVGASKSAFSTRNRRDSLMSSVSHEETEQLTADKPHGSDKPKSKKLQPNMTVDINNAVILFDIATGWLLVKAGQKMASVSEGIMSELNSSTNIQKPPASSSKSLNFSLQTCSIKFLQHLTGIPYHGRHETDFSSHAGFSPVQDIVLQVSIAGAKSSLGLGTDTMEFHLKIAKFVLGYASEDLISFNEDLKMRESVRDILAPVHNDLSLSITKTTGSARVDLSTLPIHLNLNIQRLEELLGWFGGLSTILELGSSIASVSTVREEKPAKPVKSSPGVRFAGIPPAQPAPASSTSIPWKVNARIGGVLVGLVGEACALELRTTAVKVVSRFEGIGIQIDKGELSGPYLIDDGDDAPAKVTLGNIRVEYLFSPREVDLDRLLSLLTPSQDKYEEDDDIMLDTLLRQRRQGAVLRVTVTTLNLFISGVHGLHPLTSLPNEVAKLSNVAKYLPEDDRPGMMTLALIREFETQVHVGGKIGNLNAISHDVEVAHISIPSLVAGQVKRLSVNRNGTEELIGEALERPPAVGPARPSVPMIMTRFLADEMEPTVKVKLYNLRVEYIVSALMALLGLGDDTTSEDLAVHLANSVANITDLQTSLHQTMSPAASAIYKPETKPYKLSVSLRDCVVGLNPRDMPAKGLVVFTFAKFMGSLEKEVASEANFEIKKATVMIIDDTENIDSVDTSNQRSISAAQSEQIKGFTDKGFVPVSFISSAMISAKINHPGNDGTKSVDIEVRDDLLILETCADSTQTFIGLLNGLSPPTPPSTALKYRTEVMPIQDMLASFTGDAFATDEITDAEHILGQDFDEELGGAIEDELEYVSEFYHQKPDQEEAMSASMMSLTSDVSRPAHLLDSFHSDDNVTTSMSGLDFRDDHFARQSTVGGTAHRWDSSHNTYGLANEVKIHGSPLRVRVRDVHFIWNLFDGYDWQRTRDTISKAVKDVEMKATERRAKKGSLSPVEEDEEESVIGDFLFNSIYIGIPANKDPRELSRAINHDIDDLASETGSYITSTTVTGMTARQNRTPSVRAKKLRLSRSRHHKMTFELKGISADLVVFPPNAGETQSSIDVRVNDLEIFDHIPTSTWKKFATYMYDAGERESGTSMVHLEILNVKPVAELAASEIVLKATLLPLRLHVDQDALDFLSRFFEFKDESVPAPSSPSDAPFLQRVEVNAIPVKLDFKPKRVDYAGLRSGRTTEFMNFFVLDEADMVMRHVIIYGVSGFDKLGQTLNDIWMPDIKRNQLPGVLAGLAPIRSLVNVGSGFKDLVVVPMREYKKDGRIVRSIQKGAFSFAKTTSNELIKLGAKLAIGTQTVLQNAEDFLGAPKTTQAVHHHFDGEGDSADEEEKKQISHYADQPVGVVQGLRGAFSSLERDLLTARDAIVAVPGEVMESGSAAGAAKAVWRRAPTVILRPAIGATRAVGQTLLGAGNTLDPANRRRIEDKYKRH